MGMRARSQSKTREYVSKLYDVKKAVNGILENGAYSDKNFEKQMNKKGENYNIVEKNLVTIAYMYKKYNGEKLQKELFDSIKNDKEFIEYLKSKNKDIYNILKEMEENKMVGV